MSEIDGTDAGDQQNFHNSPNRTCKHNPFQYSYNGRMLDLQSWGHEFNSRSGRYEAVTTRIDDYPRRGKLSQYITNIKINSAFHPSEKGKSSTGLFGWGYGAADAANKPNMLLVIAIPGLKSQFQDPGLKNL